MTASKSSTSTFWLLQLEGRLLAGERVAAHLLLELRRELPHEALRHRPAAHLIRLLADDGQLALHELHDAHREHRVAHVASRKACGPVVPVDCCECWLMES